LRPSARRGKIMCNRSHELQSYLDDELNPSQRADFESHLATCADCAADLARLRNLSNLIRSYEPQLPFGMMSRVYEAIEDASGRMIIRLVTRLTAVAAALLLASSLWLVSQTRAQLSEPENVADAQQVVLPTQWEHAAVALNADPSPDVQFASLVLADTSSARGQ
jgi:anti-sigma factor RsiW